MGRDDGSPGTRRWCFLRVFDVWGFDDDEVGGWMAHDERASVRWDAGGRKEKLCKSTTIGMSFLDDCKDFNRDANSFQVLYTSSRIENKPRHRDKTHSGLFSEFKKFPTETTIDLDTRRGNIERITERSKPLLDSAIPPPINYITYSKTRHTRKLTIHPPPPFSALIKTYKLKPTGKTRHPQVLGRIWDDVWCIDSEKSVMLEELSC